MKSRAWIALIVALVLTATACGGDPSPDTADVPAGDASPTAATADGDGATTSDEPVTVTYWHAYNEEGPESETLNTVVIPAFEAEHPSITIEAVAYPYDDLRQILITSTAGGTLPCLVRSDIIWVPELAELGVLAPLDERMDDFDEIAATTYGGVLATNLWDGNYYGLPLDTNTRVLMYNQASLDAAGVAGPPETFEELQRLGESLDGQEMFAFADNGTSGWNMLPWIWSGGGALTDDEITTASGHLNSPESVAAVEMLVDLHDQGAIPDLILGADDGVATSVGLPQGQYATILDGPWMFPIFEAEYADFDLQTAMVPAGPGGSISVVGGEDIVMTESCPEPEAAVEVIRYMLSESAQTAMAEVGQMPVLAGLGETLTDIQPYYAIFAEQLETARPRTPHPQYPQIEEILSNEIQRAFRGEATVQEALDSAAQQIDPILADG